MNQLKRINPFWAFIVIILGWTLFKHFNFNTYSFSEGYVDIVYLIVFAIGIYFLVKEFIKKDAK